MIIEAKISDKRGFPFIPHNYFQNSRASLNSAGNTNTRFSYLHSPHRLYFEKRVHKSVGPVLISFAYCTTRKNFVNGMSGNGMGKNFQPKLVFTGHVICCTALLAWQTKINKLIERTCSTDIRGKASSGIRCAKLWNDEVLVKICKLFLC